MARKKCISRNLPENPPEEIKEFLKEVATAFDVTLATLHPDEMGEERWLVFMEFACGEEHSQYVQTKLAADPKYIHRWIESMHNYLVRKRSVR